MFFVVLAGKELSWESKRHQVRERYPLYWPKAQRRGQKHFSQRSQRDLAYTLVWERESHARSREASHLRHTVFGRKEEDLKTKSSVFNEQFPCLNLNFRGFSVIHIIIRKIKILPNQKWGGSSQIQKYYIWTCMNTEIKKPSLPKTQHISKLTCPPYLITWPPEASTQSPQASRWRTQYCCRPLRCQGSHRRLE